MLWFAKQTPDAKDDKVVEALTKAVDEQLKIMDDAEIAYRDLRRKLAASNVTLLTTLGLSVPGGGVVPAPVSGKTPAGKAPMPGMAPSAKAPLAPKAAPVAAPKSAVASASGTAGAAACSGQGAGQRAAEKLSGDRGRQMETDKNVCPPGVLVVFPERVFFRRFALLVPSGSTRERARVSMRCHSIEHGPGTE